MNEIEKLEAALKHQACYNRIREFSPEKNDQVCLDYMTIEQAAKAHLHYKREIEPLVRELVHKIKKIDINGCYVMSDLSEIGGSKDDVEIWVDTGLTVARIENGLDPDYKIPTAEFFVTAAQIATKLKEIV